MFITAVFVLHHQNQSSVPLSSSLHLEVASTHSGLYEDRMWELLEVQVIPFNPNVDLAERQIIVGFIVPLFRICTCSIQCT